MVLPPLVSAWAHAAHSNPSWLRGPLADYLASGGDPDDVDENGKPLLHIAVGTHSGSHEVYHMVRAVLAAGPRNVDIRWEGLTPLHIAITNFGTRRGSSWTCSGNSAPGIARCRRRHWLALVGAARDSSSRASLVTSPRTYLGMC